MTNLNQYLKLAKNRLFERLLVLISLLILANIFFFPSPTFADVETSTPAFNATSTTFELAQENQGITLMEILNPEVIINGTGSAKDAHLPQNSGLEPKYSMTAVLTAYNSDIGQTDNSPCITASGFDLCKHGQEDSVAINGVRMGTRVRFPELFGDRVFVVRDRMNARYNSNHVDIWMLSKADAKTFGVKQTRMDILE